MGGVGMLCRAQVYARVAFHSRRLRRANLREKQDKMRAKTAVVLGAQWGDEGKGKIVDVLSERFSAVARYAGGHNAGHTVIHGDKRFVLQLIPCGVLRPGCKAIIGNGVVLDPIAFLAEVAKVREFGLDVDGQLFVSNRAQVILPYRSEERRVGKECQ